MQRAKLFLSYSLISPISFSQNFRLPKIRKPKKKNPGYMKENFVICIESLHVGDIGNQHNVSDAEVGDVCICRMIRTALHK